MSGIPEFNFPAFNAAEIVWKNMGWEVTNPATLDDGETDKEWSYYMKRDLPELLKCDAIALLKGWGSSKGANLELMVAQACGLQVYCAESMLVFEETVLEEAQRLVMGARQADYSHPSDDFGRTAKIWSAILGCDVTPKLVPLCMVGVKLSREVHKHKRDNLVDMAGYAQTAQMVEDHG
jgi:hypothetical protein